MDFILVIPKPGKPLTVFSKRHLYYSYLHTHGSGVDREGES